MQESGFKILLIEDDPDDAELASYILKKNRITDDLLHIDDGEKALQYLTTTRELPQLILLDLIMPGVDGIQILQKLKNDPQKKHIPIVAFISSIEGIEYVESFQVKADAYMMKPVDLKKIMTALDETGLSSNLENRATGSKS